MSTTDSIADMLTRIRNANTANKETVSMPSSRKLVEIARIMKQEGYITEYEIISKAPQDELFIHAEVRGQEGEGHSWPAPHF